MKESKMCSLPLATQHCGFRKLQRTKTPRKATTQFGHQNEARPKRGRNQFGNKRRFEPDTLTTTTTLTKSRTTTDANNKTK